MVEDELANPLLGIAAPPGRYPWQAHARSLVAHLIYGVATDAALGVLGATSRAERAPVGRHPDTREHIRR